MSGSKAIFPYMKFKRKSSLHVTTSVQIHYKMFNALVFSKYTCVTKSKAISLSLCCNICICINNCPWNHTFGTHC